MPQKSKPALKSKAKKPTRAPESSKLKFNASLAKKKTDKSVRGIEGESKSIADAKAALKKEASSSPKAPLGKAIVAKAAPAKASLSKTSLPKASLTKANSPKENPLDSKAQTKVGKVPEGVATTQELVQEPAQKESKKSRRVSISVDPNEASSALVAKWTTLFKKAEQIESKPYNMRSVFEEKTGLMHKVLGWGFILTNKNDRLEVLFKDGIKYLISNYKA